MSCCRGWGRLEPAWKHCAEGRSTVRLQLCIERAGPFSLSALACNSLARRALRIPVWTAWASYRDALNRCPRMYACPISGGTVSNLQREKVSSHEGRQRSQIRTVSSLRPQAGTWHGRPMAYPSCRDSHRGEQWRANFTRSFRASTGCRCFVGGSATSAS